MIYGSTCHWRIEKTVSIALAGFELKEVFGQEQSAYTIFYWDLILPGYLHDLPTTSFIMFRASPGQAH